MSDTDTKGRFSIVVPVYNHEEMVRSVVEAALKLELPVIIVDDGSTDSTPDILKEIPGTVVVRHATNQGKGAAIMTGFREAVKIADWAITIDADGQHNPDDIPGMIDAIPDGIRPIVIGARTGMEGEDVPWTSSFGRKFSNFWVRLSGGPKILDSQTGFRIYPLPESINLKVTSQRFQFEIEVLAKAGWKNIPVIETPVSVNYRPGGERISHFRPFVDFVRNSRVFTRLITQRLLLPQFIRSRF